MADSCCEGESKYYKNDVGTEILVETCSDISTATKAELWVKKPDGTFVIWPGVVVESTKIRYIVKSGDFDQAGVYKLQAYVDMPGWSGRGETVTFRVRDSFDD